MLSEIERTLLSKHGIEVGERLGGGATCDVYSIGPYKGHSDLCIKYMRDEKPDRVETEFNCYKVLYENQPSHFARVVDLIEIEFPDEDYPDRYHVGSAIVMEKLQKVNKQNRSVHTIIKLIFDVAVCLSVMHIKSKTHRDIKLDNIMYCPRTGIYTLVDYGIAANIHETFTENSCRGTINNMAPECLRREYSKRSDFYSLGMTAREWFVGPEMDMPDTIELADKTKFEYWYEQKASLPPLDEDAYGCPEFIRIINKLTQFNINNRYQDCFEVITALRDVVRQYKVQIISDNSPRDVFIFAINQNYSILAKKEIEKLINDYSTKHLAGGNIFNIFGFKDVLYARPLPYCNSSNNQEEIIVLDEEHDFLKKVTSLINKLPPIAGNSGHPNAHICLIGTSALISDILHHPIKYLRRYTDKTHNPLPVVYRINYADNYASDVTDSGISEIVLVNSRNDFERYLEEWVGGQKGDFYE